MIILNIQAASKYNIIIFQKCRAAHFSKNLCNKNVEVRKHWHTDQCSSPSSKANTSQCQPELKSTYTQNNDCITVSHQSLAALWVSTTTGWISVTFVQYTHSCSPHSDSVWQSEMSQQLLNEFTVWCSHSWLTDLSFSTIIWSFSTSTSTKSPWASSWICPGIKYKQ